MAGTQWWMAALLTLSFRHLPQATALPSMTTSSPLTETSPAIPYSPGPHYAANTTGMAELPSSLLSLLFPTHSPIAGLHSLNSSVATNALSQDRTNGNSPLGTDQAPTYPQYLAPWPSWGNLTAGGTNPYKYCPSTGVVRSYNFVISRGTIAPDGVERSVLLVNGAFPGPTIEANWGDTIQVTVTNSITGPEEGTALHWHGLLQKGTPYEDGVPGITQCPIAPGETFTYSFKADLYGTSWYHSHYSAQYAGGLFGAMIIYGPPHASYDKDLGPVLLSDYYHRDYYSILQDVMGTDLSKVAPHSDNNLINGKGIFNCSSLPDSSTCTPNAGLSKFEFRSGNTYLLRLINPSSEAIQRFSIDGHVLTVIAYDFVPVVPYTTQVVTLGVGQRAEVIVHANGSATDSYWMRSNISETCSLPNQPYGLAIVHYQHADTSVEPKSTIWPIDDSVCGNDPLDKTEPLAPITPPTADTRVDIDVNIEINGTGHLLWTMDGSSFRTDYNDPILLLADAGNDSYPTHPEWNLYNFGRNNSFIIVINNKTPVVHPMHIHGHNFFVLNEGLGSWDDTTVRSSNPMRRDVQLLQPKGYIALQIEADNPGIWPFHCHIAWHVSGGLYINILERPDLIPSQIDIPSKARDLCTSWNAFTSPGPIDQIDSGLRARGRFNRPWFADPMRRSYREVVTRDIWV